MMSVVSETHEYMKIYTIIVTGCAIVSHLAGVPWQLTVIEFVGLEMGGLATLWIYCEKGLTQDLPEGSGPRTN
jgi:hypothetical protein